MNYAYTTKSKGMIVLIVWAFFGAACSSDKTAFGSETRDAAPPDAADARVEDSMASDAEDAEPRSDIRDASSDGDSDALGDTNWPDEEFFECDCADPQAVCREELVCCSGNPIWCARPDLECDETGDCPEGYSCNFDGFCECQDSRECAPRCQTDDDCRGYAKCDPLESICVHAPPCRGDSGCVAGEWCMEVPDYGEICTETGSKPPGEECEDDIDCDSGICKRVECVYSGETCDPIYECARRCNKESDCPDEQECGFYRGKYVCESTSYCQVDCPDGYCAEDECRPARCNRSGDCTDGNCVLAPEPNYTDPGTCDDDVEQYCKDNEFQYKNDDGVYCRIPLNCSVDEEDNCPPPYECLGNDEPEGYGYRSTCTRRLDGT